MNVEDRHTIKLRKKAMATKKYSIVAFLIVLCCIHNTVEASYSEEAKVIRVDGKVLCQDCTEGWNQWVNGARPIIGGKVSVTCLDERKRVVYYGSDLTDETGQFEMTIKKYTAHGKELQVKRCSVRLVSSPDATCNVLTDFAGGRSGVKLRRPSSVYRDIVKYTIGPFYYTTPMCEEPDTHEESDDEGHEHKY